MLQAHYAGVILLDLLGEEQERIARRLALLEAQIEAETSSTDKLKPTSKTATRST